MHEVTILDGPRVLCTHPRIPEGERAMSRLDDHRWGRERRRWNKGAKQPEEVWLESRSLSLKMFLAELRRQVGRRYPYQVRQLYGLCHDYEATLVIPCVERSMNYGLYDVSRLERMLLKEHGTKLFQLNGSVEPFFQVDGQSVLAKKSTIITTNLGFDDWGNFFSDPAMRRRFSRDSSIDAS